MAATRGWLDAQGCPFTRIAVFPEGRPATAKDFDALIDTGFTGFVQIPHRAAIAIGLAALGERPRRNPHRSPKDARISIAFLLESLAAGMTIPEIVRAYPTLTEEAVRGALEELAHSKELAAS